jgi:small subunit ribosomal protein S21
MVETLSINHALKEGKTIVEVSVKDNNIEGALRILKKKMQREGIFKEMKMRSYFEKPSQKKLREKAENIRRSRKVARRKIYG